jgi:hypothetical protein
VHDTFVHGNVIDGMVQWDSGTSDREIPNSLYLPYAPWFLEGHEWPAIGPDAGSGCSNPALQRWQSGDAVPEPYDPLSHAVRRIERRVQPLSTGKRLERGRHKPSDRAR